MNSDWEWKDLFKRSYKENEKYLYDLKRAEIEKRIKERKELYKDIDDGPE